MLEKKKRIEYDVITIPLGTFNSLLINYVDSVLLNFFTSSEYYVFIRTEKVFDMGLFEILLNTLIVQHINELT